MEIDLPYTLKTIVNILTINGTLSALDNHLISISDKKILTPIGDVIPLLSLFKSKLKDQLIEFNLLHKLIQNLTIKNSLVRINHIGFCYKVSSQLQELNRLKQLMNSSVMRLYEEPSNDDGKWLFIGNSENWKDMMIELIVIEKTNDIWKEYWLPHIQIDIDTTLTENEIVHHIETIFGDSIKPKSIKIDGIVYIVRNRLGIVDGVNINLDIATNSRNVKYQRQIMLQKLV